MTRDPGNFKFKEYIIPARDHIYMCYNDFGIEHNPDRPVNIGVYVGVERKLYISPYTIRDTGKIELRYENERVTPNFSDMYMVARIGLIIKIKGATKEIKNCWGNRWRRGRRNRERVTDGKG